MKVFLIHSRNFYFFYLKNVLKEPIECSLNVNSNRINITASTPDRSKQTWLLYTTVYKGITVNNNRENSWFPEWTNGDVAYLGGKNFAPINARALRRVAEKCWPNEGTGMTGPQIALLGSAGAKRRGGKQKAVRADCVRNTQLRLGPTAVRQPNQPGYAQPRLLLIRTRHFIRACAVCLPCATSSTWTWLLHNGRGGPRDQTPGAFFIAASPLRGTPLFDDSAEQFLRRCARF